MAMRLEDLLLVPAFRIAARCNAQCTPSGLPHAHDHHPSESVDSRLHQPCLQIVLEGELRTSALLLLRKMLGGDGFGGSGGGGWLGLTNCCMSIIKSSICFRISSLKFENSLDCELRGIASRSLPCCRVSDDGSCSAALRCLDTAPVPTELSRRPPTAPR
ncbi:hypothetical protein ACLKA6_005744 [Drosophila palustris]